MVTAAGRKVLQKAIFSFWERIPRRKTGELQSMAAIRGIFCMEKSDKTFQELCLFRKTAACPCNFAAQLSLFCAMNATYLSQKDGKMSSACVPS